MPNQLYKVFNWNAQLKSAWVRINNTDLSAFFQIVDGSVVTLKTMGMLTAQKEAMLRDEFLDFYNNFITKGVKWPN